MAIDANIVNFGQSTPTANALAGFGNSVAGALQADKQSGLAENRKLAAGKAAEAFDDNTPPERVTELKAEIAKLDPEFYLALMTQIKKGEGAEIFSATTTSLPGGITIQTTSTGRKIVTDAGGQALSGPAATDAINQAEELKAERAISIAGGKAEAAERSKLGAQKELLPGIRSAIKTAEKSAEGESEASSSLISAQAAMPGLRTVVSNLKALSGDATFTLAGRGFNAVAKELGFSTKGDTARSSMIAMVDNQVLPLLKPIFGAAFTAAEGDRLRNAFLDPNSTPDSRKASLDAFLSQMERNIEAKEAELSALSSETDGANTSAPADNSGLFTSKSGVSFTVEP